MIDAPSTISIVVPVFNDEAHLADAIDSLLGQTRPPDQVIVVDDGSTDGSLSLARTCAARDDRIVVLTQPKAGAAAARNRGIAAATGDAIGFLDADDLAEPHKIGLQLARLEDDPTIAGTIGGQRVVVEDGAPEPVWMAARRADARWRPHLMTMVVRRSLFDSLGGFDPTLTHGEDTDWLLRAGEAGHRIEVIEEVLVTRRVHRHNLTQDADAVVRSQFEVLARRVRRRKDGA